MSGAMAWRALQRRGRAESRGPVPRRVARPLALALAGVAAAPAAARADKPPVEQTWVNLEIDPLPFATGGFGVQPGVRLPALRGVRLAVACFSLDVPGFAAELGGNEGFDIHVRPSPALYVLYYLQGGGRDGFAFGGALRYLRLTLQHEAEPGEARVNELSPELIAAYQWHPLPGGAARGLYLLPWIGLSVTATVYFDSNKK